ncbi:MAG TPA: hypothetical protein VN375_05810 [Vicinamibacteria bacterium]|jgi:hypothetical protein|nr:hypothetical protein [Vicinamibacteria bacterium]
MDEFTAYHALGCAAYPLSRQYNVYREGCQEYRLRPPLVPVFLPLRSYVYVGSLPVVSFYPFWRLFRDPVSVRVQGALFFLVALHLVGRLLGVGFLRALLAGLVFPLFAGAFFVDTGPVGLSLVLLLGALLLIRAAGEARDAVRRNALAAAAGFLCFLGVWIKLVFVWCLPALLLAIAARAYGGRRPRTEAPPRPWLAVAAFLLAWGLPTAWLLASVTVEGTPYYEVLRQGRFSLEPEAAGAVAAGLAAYLSNGSSVVPRSMIWPPSGLDLLPALLGLGLLGLGLAGPRRRDVLFWLGAALLTFAVTILSGRALSAHHLVFALLFLVLALASALGPPGHGLIPAGASAVLVGLFWASLLWRAPGVLIDPRSNFAKDRLLAWVRESGLDRSTVELHASWGTYYIAHLFGDPAQAVLFSRKFARDPGYLAQARELARSQGRGILLITGEPERLEKEVVEGAWGPPLATHRFDNWWAWEYLK